MEKKQLDPGILNDLAPCGISCARCVGYHDGVVKKLSAQLL